MKQLNIMMILVLALTACSQQKPKGERQGPGEQRVVKVMAAPFKQTLFFSGVIKPLSLASVSSPFDSVIVEKNANFGQTVKEGDLLFVIESSQLEKEYDAALAAYLKAKDDLSTGTSKFSGTEDLWKLGLISKNEFVSQQSNISNLKIGLIQKERELEEMFRKIGRSDVELIKKLKISDTEGVSKALESKLGLIKIYAPSAGVFLEPPKTSSTEGDKTIEVGSDVKQGAPLGLIGNLQGLSINIKISEIDLQKVVPGLKASITGVAFPGEELQGIVQRVNSQAQSSGGVVGGLPTFSGEVIVNQLTDQQKKIIKVGMSAKVNVNIAEETSLRIPLTAVYEENGQLLVKKKVKGEFIAVPVVTGSTSSDSVVVKEGVEPGDEILVPGTLSHEPH